MPTLSIIISEISKKTSLPSAMVKLDNFIYKTKTNPLEIIVLSENEDVEKQVQKIKEFLPELRFIKKGEDASFEGEDLAWIDITKGNIEEQMQVVLDCKKRGVRRALISSRRENNSFFFRILENINSTITKLVGFGSEIGFPAGLCGAYAKRNLLNGVDKSSVYCVAFDIFKQKEAPEIIEIENFPCRVGDYPKLWREIIRSKVKNKAKKE